METKVQSERPSCPLCHHALVPVHAVEGSLRRVLYHTCPGPYCEFVMLREPKAPLPKKAKSERSIAS